MQPRVTVAWISSLLAVCMAARCFADDSPEAQTQPGAPAPSAQAPNSTNTYVPTNAESTTPLPQHGDQWIDHFQNWLYDTIWHTAMHVDRWFGSEEPDVAYAQTSGSIAPGFLWDQFNGSRTLFRFHADVPLPQLNEEFHAFVARVNPEEFISESQRESGAFPNAIAPSTQDQTLLGIEYFQPRRQGLHLDAGVGLPIALPLDPYVKGGYIYAHGAPESGVLTFRQFSFYQNSQGGLGITSRLDLQRLIGQSLMLAWAGSTTIAQHSHGWASFSTFDAFWAFPGRRALDLELFIDGTSQALVPLHDYGFKLAYRRSLFRDWLVLELRTGVDWPKIFPDTERKSSIGVGLGFEMFFGTDEFLARPVTF
ncbi:MAG TPA: hypothetical protein VMG11_10975 [Steroidobacteraceae bacterium]|nr:hypothetical protein [Steroidobacteraceae bacterium]